GEFLVGTAGSGAGGAGRRADVVLSGRSGSAPDANPARHPRTDGPPVAAGASRCTGQRSRTGLYRVYPAPAPATHRPVEELELRTKPVTARRPTDRPAGHRPESPGCRSRTPERPARHRFHPV